MANNHMGDVEHGERIIRVFGELAKEYPEISFAFKLQYRNLDTFIHKSVAHREDINTSSVSTKRVLVVRNLIA